VGEIVYCVRGMGNGEWEIDQLISKFDLNIIPGYK
jgi:hypothetical protein